MNSLENYIKSMKERLNENIFSPIFIRLANLYYINDQYEECLNVCNIGLEIYPDYLTAKILAIKALIKLEYVSEADRLLKEITPKIPSRELTDMFQKCIDDLKQKPRQERIYYQDKIAPVESYNAYSEKINKINDHPVNIEFKDIADMRNNAESILSKDIYYEKFLKDYNDFQFENKMHTNPERRRKNNSSQKQPTVDLDISKIKIVTETIADLYAKQGLLKEAFDAYSFLIKAGHSNKRRIKEKLSELESFM